MYYKQQRDRTVNTISSTKEETRRRSKQTNSPSTCLQQQRLLSSHLKGGQPIYRPLLFGACCRTCTRDIYVPPRGTSLPNCIRSRCTESRPVIRINGQHLQLCVCVCASTVTVSYHFVFTIWWHWRGCNLQVELLPHF